MKVVVTGATGLIGWHAAARIHAANRHAHFQNKPEPFHLETLQRNAFQNQNALENAVADARVVLHFAGVNRASDEALEGGNEALATRLSDALSRAGSHAAVVYANSIHEASDTPYGRGKRGAAEVLKANAARRGAPFVDLILPHVFGEGGRPFYNNVTGTLCRQIVDGTTPTINPDGAVELVHAGAAAQAAIDLGLADASARHRMEGVRIGIPALYETLRGFHDGYADFVFPDLSDPFHLALFNTYRQHLYPGRFPRPVTVHADARGRLFECAKGGGGGQTFMSWTEPGVVRGEHFHLNKVERFLVVEGTARIAMRKVLTDETHVFEVSGGEPSYVDMPTLWTHNISNIGNGPLVTLFWTHDIFDPAMPDTFADKVGT